MRERAAELRKEILQEQRLAPTLADIFSIEASFVLFLFAGRYKELPELRGFPVDFTLLFLATTSWLIMLALVSRRAKPPPLDLPVLAMIAFSALAALSLFWSSMNALNTDKVSRFLLFTSSSFFLGCMLTRDSDRRARLLRLIVWFSCALLVYYAYYRYIRGVDLADKEETAYSNNYLEYGGHAQILFVALVSVATLGASRQAFGAVIGATVALFALATIGGRGPFTFALLAVPLLMAGLISRPQLSLRQLTRLFVLVAAWMLIGVLGYTAIGGLGSSSAEGVQLTTLERFELHLSGESTSSMDVRFEGRHHAFEAWLERPIFGWGIGEFRVQDSFLEYPHNLLLEILMEIGLLGAFLFCLTCAVAVIRGVRAMLASNLSWVEATIVLIFLPELVSHLTIQGYLADDRAFFAYIGMAIGAGSDAIRRRGSTRLRAGHSPKALVRTDDVPAVADRARAGP